VRTFWIQTLGCRVNHYESEQIATLLRSRGLVETDARTADLRIINTCSVTLEAASKSRTSARRAVKLNVLAQSNSHPSTPAATLGKTILTGCWATSDPADAHKIPGVDAVIGHHENVAARFNEILDIWRAETAIPEPIPPCGSRVLNPHPPQAESPISLIPRPPRSGEFPPEPIPPGGSRVPKPHPPQAESSNFITLRPPQSGDSGTHSLPQLGQRQSHHQRAFLKIQDGCDAHCTYCIIPRLRPSLWTKPNHESIEEARRLVAAGHVELVLTGIFLGAYGQPTALRRRQSPENAGHLARLIDDLCTQVPGLLRLRLSSIEPGDLTDDLLSALRAHSRVVPHFHLPLQSGSPEILRRMNRQYTRDDYLRLIDRITDSFDRPALTTDIIVGFPGETDADFAQTQEVVRHARFIHIHAFPYSSRPGTAAARWKEGLPSGTTVRQRIDALIRTAAQHSQKFRKSFLGQSVQLLVERFPDQPSDALDQTDEVPTRHLRHGRCERYFDVQFESKNVRAGDLVTVLVKQVTSTKTLGKIKEIAAYEEMFTFS
jgi:MiaB/RimO family radical SAM methylthiotransferase